MSASLDCPDREFWQALSNGTVPAGEQDRCAHRMETRKEWRPLLVLVCLSTCLLGFPFQSLFLAAQGTPSSGELREVLAYDFRGRPLPPDLAPYELDADRLIKVEPEGLRITLPRDRFDRSPQGLSLPLQVAGDFEITTTLEVIEADEPAPGTRTYGVGLLMSLNEAARIGRLSRANGEEVVTWDRWATVQGNPRFLLGAAPCAAKVVRLRLKRTATTLRFLWAPETAGDNFEEIHQCDFGTDDITKLRLELNARLGGAEPALLDLRLLEFKVSSSSPSAGLGVPPGGEGPSRSKGWLLAAGFLGLAIVLGWIILQVCRAIGQRRRGGGPPEQSTDPEAEKPAVSFPCPSCGKHVQAGAGMAGKHVKCPHCGEQARVPPLMGLPPPSTTGPT